MTAVDQVLRTVLESFGFDIQESSVEEKKIIARKEDMAVYVGYILEPEDGLESVNNHKIKSGMGDYDKVIIAALCAVTRSMENLCKENGFALWDRDKLIREIGRAVLEGSIEGFGNKTIEKESKEDEALGAFFSAVSECGAVESQDDTSETVPEKGGHLRVLPLKFGVDDIKSLAGPQISGYDYQLQLLPIYLFNYNCEIISVDNGDSIQASGVVGVNAVTGKYYNWAKEYDTVEDLEWDYDIMESKLDMAGAEDIARKGISDINTRVVERVDERETATIIERRSFKPKEDSVQLEFRHTVYLPVWGIAGKEGIMLIDGTNGRVMKEDIFHSEVQGEK